jgi:hypothetical protein
LPGLLLVLEAPLASVPVGDCMPLGTRSLSAASLASCPIHAEWHLACFANLPKRCTNLLAQQ